MSARHTRIKRAAITLKTKLQAVTLFDYPGQDGECRQFHRALGVLPQAFKADKLRLHLGLVLKW